MLFDQTMQHERRRLCFQNGTQKPVPLFFCECIEFVSRHLQRPGAVVTGKINDMRPGRLEHSFDHILIKSRSPSVKKNQEDKNNKGFGKALLSGNSRTRHQKAKHGDAD